MNPMNTKLMICVVACVALTCSLAIGVESRNPDHDGMIWAEPEPSGPKHNFGATASLPIGRLMTETYERRIIMHFDLSDLSGGPLVTAAGGTLSLTVDLDVSGDPFKGTPVGRTFQLYQIDSSEAGWIEGTGNNSNPATGETNWDYHTYASTAWGGGGGLGAPGGGSYAATPLDSLLITEGMQTVGSVWNFSIPKSVLDDWITNDGNNAGLLLRDSTSAIYAWTRFASKDNVTVGDRPTLTFEIPEPATLSMLGLGGLVAILRRRRS